MVWPIYLKFEIYIFKWLLFKQRLKLFGIGKKSDYVLLTIFIE